jgi:hypothetical protein
MGIKMQDAPAKVTVHDIVKVISENPGVTSGEIAEKLAVPKEVVGSRLYSMCSVRTPVIKRGKTDGETRFYPIAYQITPDLAANKPFDIVSIEGQAVRVFRVSPEELAEIDRRAIRGKYAELLDVMEKLTNGEGVFIPKSKVSKDGLRRICRAYFKDSEKTFNFKVDGTYLICVRVS